MCATCGCLTTAQHAPEDGAYKCVECDKASKMSQVTVKKGDAMPACSTCAQPKVHWVKT